MLRVNGSGNRSAKKRSFFETLENVVFQGVVFTITIRRIAAIVVYE